VDDLTQLRKITTAPGAYGPGNYGVCDYELKLHALPVKYAVSSKKASACYEKTFKREQFRRLGPRLSVNA
jgi:hypothetical protein